MNEPGNHRDRERRLGLKRPGIFRLSPRALPYGCSVPSQVRSSSQGNTNSYIATSKQSGSWFFTHITEPLHKTGRDRMEQKELGRQK